MDSSEKMNSIIYMDPVLYKAAEEGNIDPFENCQTCLDQLLTPDENTILLVYLRNQTTEPESTDFVYKILERCPPLLFQANKIGETPLHLAARYGHANVVKLLIERAGALPSDPESRVTKAKMMLRMTNGERDTALHEAARNNQSHVVEILTKEDPEFPYSANVDGETPLYIAASSWVQVREKVIDEILTNCISAKHYIAASIIPKSSEERGKVVDGILGTCISVDYGGPNGRTALHAASAVGDDETARKLLEKEKKLTKTTDESGWSPLHYAAYFSTRLNISVVKVLLEYDASAAYIAETKKKRTALHIAAIQGHVDVMKEIISRCPACCELVDNRGWNALHYAVASNDRKVFKECLEIPELARLKTKKDDKGNTPFHLIAALGNEKKQWRRVLYKYCYNKREVCGLNKRKLSVKDIYFGDFGDFGEIQEEILESLEDVGNGPLGSRIKVLKGQNEEEKEAMSKARESHLVVAALIATVTFAAAFTLPGGYKSDQGPNEGTAILAKKAAFIVFVISDAMSMVLSIVAVFIHFLTAFIQGFEMEKNKEIDEETIEKLFGVATLFTMIGMGTMIIAFITGTCAVLEPSLGLAICTCLIGMNFFVFGNVVSGFIYKDLRD